MNRIYSNLTRTALVREPFTEQSIWRKSLGDAQPLHVFVIDGPIDAPQWLPKGSSINNAPACVSR